MNSCSLCGCAIGLRFDGAALQCSGCGVSYLGYANGAVPPPVEQLRERPVGNVADPDADRRSGHYHARGRHRKPYAPEES